MGIWKMLLATNISELANLFVKVAWKTFFFFYS